MPKLNYGLASQRLDVGGQGGGLQPTLLSGGAARGLRIPGIDSRGVNAQYTPIQPIMALDKTFQSAARFTSDVTKATFAFKRQEALIKQQLAREAYSVAEREAGLSADSTVSEFRQYVEKTTNGYTNEAGEHVSGYLDTEGKVAVDSYHQYSKDLNEVYKEYLNRLDPLARQKAMLRMTGVLDSTLGTWSVHRRKQLDIAETQQRYVEQQNVIREIASNPNAINRVNPTTGLTLKDEFMSKFKSIPKGKVAWANAMVGSAELLYQEKGSKAAEEFISTHKGELSDYPLQLARLEASLKSWKHQDDVAYNAKVDRQYRDRMRKLKEASRKTAEQLYSDLYAGKIYSKPEISKLVKAEALDPNVARAYISDVYDKNKLPDMDRFHYYLKMIPKWAENDFKDENGEDVSFDFMGDKSQTPATRKILINFENRLRAPKFRTDYKSVVEQLTPLLKGPQWSTALHKRSDEERVASMKTEVITRLSAGEDKNSILKDMFTRLSGEIHFEDLTPLRYGGSPRRGKELKRAKELLIAAFNKGLVPTNVKNQQLLEIYKYWLAINNAIKAKKATGAGK